MLICAFHSMPPAARAPCAPIYARSESNGDVGFGLLLCSTLGVERKEGTWERFMCMYTVSLADGRDRGGGSGAGVVRRRGGGGGGGPAG